jgi:hypothetical protein
MRLTELVDIAKEKTGGFGGDKLTELANSVNTALPIITQAGFEVEQTTITLGIPPKAVLRARVVRELTDEEYDALVQRVGEQVVTSLVAGTFLKAAALQRSFRVGTLLSSHIEIELSPLPAVRLIFVPPTDVALRGKVIESAAVEESIAVT